ncbi:MAG: hypothetical protein IPJ85_17640 [Flavobacteriales bacterium]|nr:hypothetical protein [Flavobacteriales bacterium]
MNDEGAPTGAHIALEHRGGRVFRTASPIPKGTRFKIEVTNNLECYTYIFGEETNRSTYVLFQYTPKHSPYCGTTGMRQFPRDHSLTADDTGNMDDGDHGGQPAHGLPGNQRTHEAARHHGPCERAASSARQRTAR